MTDIRKIDREYVAGTYGRYDLAIEKGKGSRCFSYDGKEYIDFTSGIGVNSLGYCDDRWIDAVTEQLNRVQHTSNLYYTAPCAKLAEKLVKRTGMKKVFFGNSGAEANEAAIKTARKFGVTGKGENATKIITLENSFHGRTMAAITATGQEDYHRFFTPFLDGFSYCPVGDMETMKELADDEVCAIMIEPVQGEGGVKELPEEFVKEIAGLCNEKDILLIMDEVQTGAGRCGRFFCYEEYGVKPDIVSFAKGIGGGLPIGGVLLGEKCAHILTQGDHGSTYGGNPVAAAGALSVLERLDEDFLDEVREKGEIFRKELKKIRGVKAVSGMGLMIGVELERAAASEVVSEALEMGLLVLTAKDRIRLLPPLNIPYADIDEGLDILEKAIGSLDR